MKARKSMKADVAASKGKTSALRIRTKDPRANMAARALGVRKGAKTQGNVIKKRLDTFKKANKLGMSTVPSNMARLYKGSGTGDVAQMGDQARSGRMR
jgi:hypothetical protein